MHVYLYSITVYPYTLDRQTAMHTTSLRLIYKNSTQHDDCHKVPSSNSMKVQKAYSDNPKNQLFLQYNLFTEAKVESKRWLANVSGKKTLKRALVQAINVQPTANKDDFQIIRSLLIAKTCHTILFDKQFSVEQTKELKELARFSGTQLAFINANIESNIFQERRLAH